MPLMFDRAFIFCPYMRLHSAHSALSGWMRPIMSQPQSPTMMTSAMTQPSASPSNNDATFRISRTVEGPLDAVWKADPKGGLTRHPMSAAWPLQTRSNTTFNALGDNKTQITIAWQPHASTVDEIAAFKVGQAAMAQGCNASFEQLDAYLAQLALP